MTNREKGFLGVCREIDLQQVYINDFFFDALLVYLKAISFMAKMVKGYLLLLLSFSNMQQVVIDPNIAFYPSFKLRHFDLNSIIEKMLSSVPDENRTLINLQLLFEELQQSFSCSNSWENT